ncbi:hypothetical protein [Raoultella sp. R2A007]|uniref:hypothetical protein n=1 Tax=Raoultella sp. R2A007 TaxID=3416669 RepID=UPI003CF1B7A5
MTLYKRWGYLLFFMLLSAFCVRTPYYRAGSDQNIRHLSGARRLDAQRPATAVVQPSKYAGNAASTAGKVAAKLTQYPGL